MNEPTGLVGFWNAGSSRPTTDWVTTATTGRFRPRLVISFRNALTNMYPMAPWVSATA